MMSFVCKKQIARIAVALSLSLVWLMSPRAWAGSDVFVGTKSTSKVSIDKIDHAAWSALLGKYVDDDGYVKYAALKANKSDVAALDRYLSHLSTANPAVAASRSAKLAFWINAYNAVTIRGILREYPTTSIRNHTAKLFGYNIWHDLQLYVGGIPYSLDHIEHKILRKMNEPRIHFAIVCASISCPRLLNRAYTAGEVERQLDANARDFFSRRQNFRYDDAAERFYLSSILSWFADDFGSTRAAQLRRISIWLPSKSARAAAKAGTASVSYLDYNWNLNEK